MYITQAGEFQVNAATLWLNVGGASLRMSPGFIGLDNGATIGAAQEPFCDTEDLRSVLENQAMKNPLSKGIFGTGSITALAFDDVFLLKLSGDSGRMMWFKGFDGSSMDTAAGVALDEFDNIFVAGTYLGSLDLQADVLTTQGQADTFVMKRAPDGSYLWSRPIAGAENQIAVGLATTVWNARGSLCTRC